MVGVRSRKGGDHSGIGIRLREARTKYRVSLEYVSSELHIPINQLRALEEEDFSVFSAELYARGAYTTYAQYLGVYSPKDLRAILRSLSQVRTRVPLKMLTPDRLWSRLWHPRFIIIGAVLCVALLIGGYIAFQLQSFWKLPALQITGPVSYVSSQDTITITGKTESDARLTVNGEQVLLKPDATFSVDVTLHVGINPVRVEVANAASRIRAKELVFLREHN